MKVSVAFSGAGYLGPIHAGASCAILDLGLPIAQVSGSSAGSIIAAALALGLKQDALKSLALSDMRGLLKFNPWSLISQGAYCSGNALLAWLDKAFRGKTCGQTTIPCKILTTDVQAGASFVFGTRETPLVPLSLATRASAAVPFIYAPVVYQGRTYVDSGVVNNLPISVLDPSTQIIGIDVDEPESYSVAPATSRAGSIIHMMLAANEAYRIQVAEQMGAKIIKVPSGSAGFLDTNLSVAQKTALFDAGYKHTTAALRQ